MRVVLHVKRLARNAYLLGEFRFSLLSSILQMFLECRHARSGLCVHSSYLIFIEMLSVANS